MPSNAEAFRRLHQDGLLLLANAWDAGSARLIESVGARAIATTSAGVAWAHGYADGDLLPLSALVATVAEIARVIRVPLSVDMEGGYSSDPATVAANVAAVADAGGVGLNIEDGSDAPDVLCAKVERVKAKVGANVFVNVRTDVYLRALVAPEKRVAETLARAARYRAAGADGLFVPGVIAPDEIRTIAAEAGLPLNVLARTGLPGASDLAALGVRRLSAGSGITSAAYGRMRTLASAFLIDGVSETMTDGAMPYAEIQALLT
jgi:2-methylisocitrate lyase-like PEP mutase family enzyme